MEAFAAEVMWKRSVTCCNARYINILSDGDAIIFEHLKEMKVYGPDIDLVREQCINHVSKALVTAMKNLVKESAIKKITLGGMKLGALTAKVMTNLAGFYTRRRDRTVRYGERARVKQQSALLCASVQLHRSRQRASSR